MIVDDIAVNVRVAQAHLESAGYTNFVTLSDSTEAMERIQDDAPDVILLDIMMPDISGLEILQQLRSQESTARLPVLILTGAESRELKHEALQLGATDFLSKPIDIEELLPRVRNSLVIKGYEDDLKTQVMQRTAELEQAQTELIHCLARAAESRDNDTGAHVIRVGKYAGLIGDELGMDQSEVSRLMQAATLHDVGKIGIRDEILQKPGKLTPEEMIEMQRHCGLGRRVLERVPGFDDFFVQDHTSIGDQIMRACSSPTIQMARTIALTHHERWDGSGYPLGLSGESIPLEGRITAVADVFDAVSSRRSYKDPFSLDESLAIIDEGSGSHFDPAVTAAFLRRVQDIVKIQIQHADVA
ncbi:Cyclic di-GMP phosphodiesterase response regulator RpfG [Rubripirellula lacrimiformis]|uniref:Cyclic di-GMP phosphodiesterase response regulator RpfG n=1 Tax=Rubripirellula lacrimiformis TaxID=1930273 RepID=A0A517NJW5_9BACT|nr:HD domain-containing phosphohydrolase [Rubripirellula lacrimiformis]QDT07333.1 Cyclic di-GMP phosphodiesterase response regulator RpfG [Rubripirellula lacrimiformis]